MDHATPLDFTFNPNTVLVTEPDVLQPHLGKEVFVSFEATPVGKCAVFCVRIGESTDTVEIGRTYQPHVIDHLLVTMANEFGVHRLYASSKHAEVVGLACASEPERVGILFGQHALVMSSDAEGIPAENKLFTSATLYDAIPAKFWLTWQKWELFDIPGSAEAAEVMNMELTKLCRAAYIRISEGADRVSTVEGIRDAMFKVMRKLTKYGAGDAEPQSILVELLNKEFRTEIDGW